jgi:hypothetical protein
VSGFKSDAENNDITKPTKINNTLQFRTPMVGPLLMDWCCDEEHKMIRQRHKFGLTMKLWAAGYKSNACK